ncbi:MoaD/ThiS family protein [Frigoribacterium sp. CFBP9039]|uniref:MoaD/ThiS family protein n=1 Tax=Frigoribacterium sp. CFBP9029 TaxID=3096541 RepID=UPI002A6A1E10|nr:MoaD/ThiS family protein [Frigoribacterium sp. CFBP9039]MDY0944800.1 MoaD/ThiS family protein [Frigoribacterium sp. CFBP9039]
MTTLTDDTGRAGSSGPAVASGPAGVSGAADRAAEPTTATLRFFAAARAAVGRDEQRIAVPTGERPTIGRLLTEVRPVEGMSAADFRDVMLRCSFLVDGITTRDREQLVLDGAVIDVMPPFAGG